MGKGWMKLRNKFSVEYREEVEQFLEVAKFQVNEYGRIRRPCKREYLYHGEPVNLHRGRGNKGRFGRIYRCCQGHFIAMNRFVEHQMLTSFKELRGDYHRHFKKTNHRRTRLLDKSSLTIIVAGPSRFYNDSTSSLSNEVSQLTVWSYSRKHMLGVARSFRRIKCWNSSPSPPQRILKIWVDDRATQKALVGNPSPSPAKVMLAIFRPHFRKLESSNYNKS
ncbi:NBS-LRR type resistance protein [Cucumis melo var. makuwa]|uniref:NBS-LRR type resistance protein n=1 Tax=Cucumis melo var. makuwa TaxID=1194695 RepID=A0A5D3DHV0_CUCMM|nr:NBS-LRR type resistance protein [Cucumis melo var. makuwa]